MVKLANSSQINIQVRVSQWCTTSGPRATSGPRRVLMWPATPNKESDYFRNDIHIKSTVDHKSSTLNQLTTIFNLTSLGLSCRCTLCSLRQNKYLGNYVEGLWICFLYYALVSLSCVLSAHQVHVRVEEMDVSTISAKPSRQSARGPSIKYVTLEGEGVREGVTVCDRGRGSRACDVMLIHIFYHTYETWNLK